MDLAAPLRCALCRLPYGDTRAGQNGMCQHCTALSAQHEAVAAAKEAGRPKTALGKLVQRLGVLLLWVVYVPLLVLVIIIVIGLIIEISRYP